MQSDPVVILAADIRKASALFDHAMAAGRHQEAQLAGNCIWDLAKKLSETAPTTPRGAATHLRLAIDLMDWIDGDEAAQTANRLTVIARHLANGWQRRRDVAYLRCVVEDYNSQKCGGMTPDVIGHIRAALAGLQNGRTIFFGFGI
jgi:hypothetical protein